jgi:hypothetical protein
VDPAVFLLFVGHELLEITCCHCGMRLGVTARLKMSDILLWCTTMYPLAEDYATPVYGLDYTRPSMPLTSAEMLSESMDALNDVLRT